MRNIILTSIPLNDLVAQIAHEVSEQINRQNHSTPPQPAAEPDEKFTGDRELAQYLGCTIQTINRLKRNGELPFHRFGRRYYYLKNEVDQAFKQK